MTRIEIKLAREKETSKEDRSKCISAKNNLLNDKKMSINFGINELMCMQ